ncbi:2-isopropylmalate synthase [Halarcobacter sp.]|uniref:2-isopropylmalate synthase n=1 Tax=Halarcobacter sp. TaxID=2321133 RepID=UPI003A8DF982
MLYKKYKQYPSVENLERQWPNKTIDKAPIYCSVDLRDGNQALVNPLNEEQKLEYFQTLVKMGFKNIEVAYPSASDTDFNFVRKLIEEDLVPLDVAIQILIPAKKEWIKRSVEAMVGVKNAVFHLYNPTNEFQREVVFKKSKEEIISMAVESMKYLIELTSEFEGKITYQYSPESFSQTELEFALEICNEVIKVVKPRVENKMIINLPNTLEACTANVYADRIEWMCNNLINKEAVIVSVHPHNDRGTSVASTELAVLAGAQKVEGTLFGNGERAGNLDLVNFAFNIYSQGINPELDLTFIDEVKKMYEKMTQLKVHERHPFVGEMIFTAFSGGHQDAVKKGIDFYRTNKSKFWTVPYLPIDPRDINRTFENIIRVNSQSGKGGVAFIIEEFLNEKLNKETSIKFGKIVKKQSDTLQRELNKEEIISLYKESKNTF